MIFDQYPSVLHDFNNRFCRNRCSCLFRLLRKHFPERKSFAHAAPPFDNLMNGSMVSCIDSCEVTRMKNKQLWMGIFSFLGMLVLILDGKTAISATQEGINLCLQTVIPSLFPFLLLSILLTSAFSGQALPSIKPLCRLFNIPSGTESIFLSGFLGGYPVGAQCIGQAYRHGLLSQNTSLHMLRFCSNAGPAFLFGMVSNFFENRFTVWLLWLVHILSALLVAQCFPAAHVIT